MRPGITWAHGPGTLGNYRYTKEEAEKETKKRKLINRDYLL